MYAIIEAGGKQHRVVEGEKLRVDLIKGKKAGESLTFDKVLMVGGDSYKVGQPTVDGASVSATVTANGQDGEGAKGDKIRVFKKKRRKGFAKTIGHRQRYTEVRIDKISG
jgi:large subunit ribosomal protein L21